jgi:hypothetical protein
LYDSCKPIKEYDTIGQLLVIFLASSQNDQDTVQTFPMNSNQPSGKMKQRFKKSGYDKRWLQTSIEVFDIFLGSIREPLVVLDSDLKVVKANHYFWMKSENCRWNYNQSCSEWSRPLREHVSLTGFNGKVAWSIPFPEITLMEQPISFPEWA